MPSKPPPVIRGDRGVCSRRSNPPPAPPQISPRSTTVNPGPASCYRLPVHPVVPEAHSAWLWEVGEAVGSGAGGDSADELAGVGIHHVDLVVIATGEPDLLTVR